MSEKTFGAWLLDQKDRTDAIGALSRAWKQLRDAGGHGRITRAKSIRELLSARLGEDWERLGGDQVIMDAENEWARGEADPAPDGYQTIGYMVQDRAAGETLAQYAQSADNTGTLAMDQEQVTRYAVLVVEGVELLLEAGKRYVLAPCVPMISEDEPDAQAPPVPAMRPDGSMDWASLYGAADHTVPEGDDLVSLGLLTRED
jgi:hypothetical protein